MPTINFIYQFEIVTTNRKLNDQQVYQYQFIVLGSPSVTINDVMVLRVGSGLDQWLEPINSGEKTKTQYTIKFANSKDPLNKLLVITKIIAA